MDLKVPDGYSSNISRCIDVQDGKISGMKCHDSHVFLHRYLPLAIRGVLRKEVCEAVIEFSFFFRELCSKTLSLENLDLLQRTIVLTLCKLEKIFPPFFFSPRILFLVLTLASRGTKLPLFHCSHSDMQHVHNML